MLFPLCPQEPQRDTGGQRGGACGFTQGDRGRSWLTPDALSALRNPRETPGAGGEGPVDSPKGTGVGAPFTLDALGALSDLGATTKCKAPSESPPDVWPDPRQRPSELRVPSQRRDLKQP